MTALTVPVPAEASQPGPPARLWQDLLGVLFTLLALVIAAKLAIPKALPPATLLPAGNCDLQREDCRLLLPGDLLLEVRLSTRRVVPNQAFTVDVVHADARIRPLAQEIRGIELDMGSPPAAFSADAGGHLRSPARIPLCTTSRMTWRLALRLDVDGKLLEWPLFFQTGTDTGDGR